MKTNIVPVVCATALALISANPTVASPHSDSVAVAVDALVGRPVGFAATVIGSAIFVISLPIAITSGCVHSSAEALVFRPARDTFRRPLGDLDYHHNPYDRDMTGIKRARS